MKLVKMLIVVALVFVMGGGARHSARRSGLQADVRSRRGRAQPPAAPQKRLPRRWALVGVLQAIGSQSLSVQTTEGMRLLLPSTAPIWASGSSAIISCGPAISGGVDADYPGHNVVTKVVVIHKPDPHSICGLDWQFERRKDRQCGQQGETTTSGSTNAVRIADASRQPQVAIRLPSLQGPIRWVMAGLAVAIVEAVGQETQTARSDFRSGRDGSITLPGSGGLRLCR